ncbi:MAG: DUF6240 domain-containing protein [Lachnospiraceae bacterium]|nr:DUF6240 domain-containing protein [Lachnospiraceae bacterium]
MKINFEETTNTIKKVQASGAYTKAMDMAALANPVEQKHGGISVDFSGKANGIGEYGRQKQDQKNILEEAKQTDAEAVKNKMLVCASTMSREDYKEMVQEGVKPGKVDVGDAVTIMDHIKTVMARSGAVIEGFNGEGDLDMEMLTKLTGSPAYANEIAKAYTENDLPFSEDSVKDILFETDKLSKIRELTDGMKQYLLENRMEPTPENLYLAKFSASEGRSRGGGYFAEDLSGYIGKSSDKLDAKEWNGQIDQFLEKIDYPTNEENRELCRFLMEGDILLTEENLQALSALETLSLPMDRQKAVSLMAEAVAEGKKAGEANLVTGGLLQRARDIKEQVWQISDEAVERVITEEKSFTIRSLCAEQRSLDAAVAAAFIQTGSLSEQGSTDAASTGEDTVLAAQKVMAQVRLQMTVSANMQLLSSGFSIDTTDLTELVDRLEAVNTKAQQRWNLSAPTPDADALFAQTMSERAEMFEMPAAVLGRIADGYEKITLHKTYEEGKVLQSVYQKAGESYEALMTAPRADLGDKIRDAFSNIDDLLAEQNLESTEDNRRAVRILAYNKMELTEENITMVRAADLTVRNLLDKMNPAATLQMIREGINPLEYSIEQLDAYFAQQELSIEQTAEKFSTFLYKLEHTDGITEDERKAYMGIYRMLHQIEKGDGSAIGAVAGSGQKLTFANLISAVRTTKKGGIDATVDDAFGGVKGSMQNSITRQIESYYQKKAFMTTEHLDPKWMKENAIGLSSTLDELVDARIIEDTKTAEELQKEELANLRDAMGASEQVVEMLQENGLLVSADNIAAMQQIVSGRGDTFRQLRALAKALDEEDEDAFSEIDRLLDIPLQGFTDEASATESYAAFTDGIKSLLEQRLQEESPTSLDVKSISLCTRQLTVMGRRSKNREFDLPAVIDGQLTNVNIRFVKDRSAQPGASIRIELSENRSILAEFTADNNTLRGIIGISDRALESRVQGKISEFSAKLLAETGKETDINIIQADTANQPRPRRSIPGAAEGSPKEMYQAAKLLLETLRTM